MRLVEAPVSYGGRFGASGGEDSLSKCEREREVSREDELREAQIGGTGLRKDKEGSRRIVGERETHETVSLCECVGENVRAYTMDRERGDKTSWSKQDEQWG